MPDRFSDRRYLYFELVDDVLAQTRTMQQWVRALPSRTRMYLVLALGLFPRIGYARVWAKLGAGLSGTGMVVPAVSEKALRELRRRLGPAPFQALFEVVAGPLAQPRTPGVYFAGMRPVSFDGLDSLKIPDTGRLSGSNPVSSLKRQYLDRRRHLALLPWMWMAGVWYGRVPVRVGRTGVI